MTKQSCSFRVKEMFLRCDFFYTTQFLRYRSQPQYRTFTGACCSMIIVVTFLSVFMNVLISTIGKTDISYNMSIIDQSNTPLNISTSAGDQGNAMLMMALGIEHFNLNDPSQRYFDIRFKVISSVNKTKTIEYVDFQPCSIDSWNITEGITQAYNRLNFNNFLCVPDKLRLSLQGKYTDNIFSYVHIEINKCDPLLNFSRPCSSDNYTLSQLSSNNFFANLYFINSYIHPDREESVEYYLQDKNYIQFNYNYGGLVNLFVSKYEVTTDQSIWPMVDNEVQEGAYAEKVGQYISYQHDGQTLAQFFIRRQNNTVKVDRKYSKLDDTLSYIGGLFGFIMSALLFMQKYTQSCFQIDAGANLYQHDQNDQIDTDSFNMFWYLGYLFFDLMKTLGFEPQWQRMKKYDNCRQEIQKQFDVCFLFQRINFIERAVKMLFREEQYQMLYLQKRPTLKEAEELRSNYQCPLKFKDKEGEVFEHTDSMVAHQVNSMSVIGGNAEHRDETSRNQSKQTSRSVKGLRKGLSMLKRQSLRGDEVSRKIICNLDRQIESKIEECLGQSHSRDENFQTKPELQFDLNHFSLSQSSNVIKVQAIDLQSNISEPEEQ